MRFTNIEYTNFLYDKKYEFQISQKPIVLLLGQDYLNNSEIKRGWRRLALNSTPLPQDFKLLGRCAEVKSKFAFFQEQREGFAINSVVFAQDAFCLIPKILNAVNVVPAVCKFLGMVDAVMDETAHVQLVVAAQTIRVNNAVRHDFLFDDRE